MCEGQQGRKGREEGQGPGWGWAGEAGREKNDSVIDSRLELMKWAHAVLETLDMWGCHSALLLCRAFVDRWWIKHGGNKIIQRKWEENTKTWKLADWLKELSRKGQFLVAKTSVSKKPRSVFNSLVNVVR